MDEKHVGVIGVGYWGRKIASEYFMLAKDRGDFKLSAASDLCEKNLLYCKESLGIPTVTSNFNELLYSSSIDALNICTPNDTHFPLVKCALEQGKHVLVEKPMTVSSRQAYELVDLAHSRALTLSVGHIYRFNNALIEIKRLMQDNYFGKILHLKLQWTTFVPPIPDRDIITDLAPHPFDILNFLLDSWPEKVTCVAKPLRRGRLEEVAYITSEFKTDVMAQIELSWMLPGKKREVTLLGSDRSAIVDTFQQKILVTEDGEIMKEYPIVANNTIQTELSHFVDCLHNKDSPVNGSDKGAKVVEMLELSHESLVDGKTVQIH